MIYTSYFARLSDLPSNVTPISICGKAPDWYKGPEYKYLAPKWEFFSKWKQTGDNDYYIKCFNEQVLSKLDPQTVEKQLYILSKCYNDYVYGLDETYDVVLICYEKPGDFCHRHLVADWLNKNGIKCEEYNFKPNVLLDMVYNEE